MENLRPTNSYLLRRTYQLYGSCWKRHVLIALAPTLFSFLIYFLGGQLATTVSRQLTRWDAGHLSPRSFEITAARLAIQFLYFGLTWILTIYAFAAVCNAVTENKSPEMQGIRDAYSAVRERLSGVVRVSMITYVLAAAGFRVVLAGSLPIAFKLGSWRHFELVYWILISAGMVALFSLLCRFGLSIPYLMDRRPPTPVREAMRASLGLSKGYESYFSVLVLKIVVATYGGYWLGRYLVHKLWLTYAFGYATSRWLTAGWGITLAVISEPFLFIGLAVLYQERTRAVQSPEFQSTAAAAATAPAPITPR